MNISEFDKVIDRRGTQSVKWDRYPQDVIPLWVADMDFPSPPEVITALQKRVEHGIFGYTHPSNELKEIIKERMSSRYHWNIDTDWLVFMPGIVSGLNTFCKVFSPDWKDVVVQTPIYPPILHAPDVSKLRKHELPLLEMAGGRYEINFSRFSNVVSRQNTQFILCNPHNPTGRVFTRTELETLADICVKNNTIICSDEIHSDLVYSNHHHIPIASLSKEVEKQTITFIAPSKTYNIAGLGCSVAIISDPDLRFQFSRELEAFAGHANLLGLEAALAAYKFGDKWLESLLLYLENNMDLITEFLGSSISELKVYPAEGTYLAWIDCRKLGLSLEPAKYFETRAKIGLNDGADFGEAGKGFVRLNFGCPTETLQQALQRIKLAVMGNND